MPALQAYLPPVPTPGPMNAGALVLPSSTQDVAGAAGPHAFGANFETATNRAGDVPRDLPSAAPSHHTRHARSPFPGPCRTRYPVEGGFTRHSLSSPQHISAQEHTRFLRRNAESTVFGELLEMLRPVDRCPNRRYIRNVELRDELWHRMYCLKIAAYASVDGMAIQHKIPSLMVDGPAYFPGSVAATFYDIGFEAMKCHGVPVQTLSERSAAGVEDAGRSVVHDILMRPPHPRDPYHGFTAYFKSLQFHAHANGLQDAADMLDRITRDDSFGHPVTGPSEAAELLADNASLLDAHLRRCERAAEPSAWERLLAAVVRPFIGARSALRPFK